jgi:hypothetical protein
MIADRRTSASESNRLVDGKSRCFGYIRISEALKQFNQLRDVDYVTICWSKGYQGPTVDHKYIPVREEIRRDSNGTSHTETMELHIWQYMVAHVMLVNWIDGIAHRVAVGTIVETAWSKFREKKRGWVLWVEVA